MLIVLSFPRDSIFLADRCNDSTITVPVASEPEESSTGSDRRAQLLKRKFNGEVPRPAGTNSDTFRTRLESEIDKYKSSKPIDTDRNPLIWWKDNQASFPLLARYVKGNGAFQATSVASERIFNVDKLVYDDRRKSLDTELGSGLVIAHDFLVRRKNPEEFRLCQECPAPQSQG